MEAHHNHHHQQQQQQNQAKEKSVADTKPQQQVTLSPPSPPSSSSSPSHEFSFTISLHTTTTSSSSSSSSSSKHHRNIFDNKTSKPNYTNSNNNNNISNTNCPLAIDLSPADEIFFHGHLLPLHLLSHLPVSPRSSTNSLDSFTLPIKDLSPSEPPQSTAKHAPIPHPTTSSSSSTTTKSINNKTKPFSLFSLGRWKKGTKENQQEEEEEEEEDKSRKVRFDMSQVIKRYMRMVRPLLFFRGRRDRRRNGIHFQRQPYSFSGVLSSRNSSGVIGGKRESHPYSAPASMRTSPSNSGLLVATATATATLPTAASDSTMEELQAAIQAAIAHCKNSIASTDKDNKLHNF